MKYRALVSLLLSLAILTLPDGHAQPRYAENPTRQGASAADSALTVLGRWAWGPCGAVNASGGLVFVGNGPTFQILDATTTGVPKIIGEYLAGGYVWDIQVRDSIAFVATGATLVILDVSDPTSPRRLSNIATPPVATRIVLSGTVLYALTFYGALYAIDVSDVTHPYIRGAVATGVEHNGYLAANGPRVYVGGGHYPGVVAVDVSNPDSLVAFDYGVGGFSKAVCATDSILLVGVDGFIRIIDVSTSLFGQVLSDRNLAGRIEGILTSGTVVYVTTSERTYMLDISNPAAPTILGIAVISGLHIAKSQQLVLVSNSVGATAVDFGNPAHPSLSWFFPTGGSSLRVALRDTLAFIASGDAGLWVVDIAKPQAPFALANVSTGGLAGDVVVSGSRAYVANTADASASDTTGGLVVIDVSDPHHPIQIGRHRGIARYSSSYVHTNSIALEGNLLYMTQTGGILNDSTLEMINVEDPTHTVSVGVFHSRYSPYDVAVKDSIAYLATADGGLRAVDCRVPDNPVEIWSFGPSNGHSVVGVAVLDTLLYADRGDTLFVMGISTPEKPEILGQLGRHYGSLAGSDLFASGSTVYWADGSLGVADVSNPYLPIDQASLDVTVGTGVAAEGELVALTDGDQGMWLLRNNLISEVKRERDASEPSAYLLTQNYPNPFNPTTTIRFYLPSRSRVNLAVYNVLGQLVSELVHAEQEAGWDEVVWNASGFASGVYVCRLQASGVGGEIFLQSKRMLLLK